MTSAAGWQNRQSGRSESAVVIGTPRPIWFGLGIVIAASVLFGGGTVQGLWSDAFVQLLCLGLLVLFVLSAATRGGPDLDRMAIRVLAALIALPFLQLIPLPPALWTLLPGRQLVIDGYEAAGIALPWMPISLDPARTFRAGLALIPGIAAFLATAALDQNGRRSLTLVYLALAFVSVVLGLAQLAQGTNSPLRFFPITNVHASVGFFANRNHYAALLYGLVPFVTAWMVGLLHDRREGHGLKLAASILMLVTLLLGVGMALSRAATGLVILAGIGSAGLAIVSGARFARYGTLVIAGAWLLGLVLIVQFALFGQLDRLADGLLDDYRFDMARITIAAAAAFQPFGSGFGTFEAVYRIFEPTEALRSVYANHAHNDFVELWLEGGWLAAVVLIAFLFWFVKVSLRVWRTAQHSVPSLDRAIPQAATISITLLILHSAVDYPLRTTAIITLFGFCCGLLIPAPPSERPATHRPASAGRSWRGAFWSRRPDSSAWRR